MSSPVEKSLQQLREFFQLEAAGGLVLMGTAALALVIANSPLSFYYDRLLDVTFEIRLDDIGLAKPLLLWINDGLMAVFFFLVGMELKREIVEGHLSTLREAALPGFAAVGGMLAPALIYAAMNHGDAVAMKGWAIPTATDIAFALGVLTLLGPRVPSALKAFLLSVAIFDDFGAIVVIALFYTDALSLVSLGIAGTLIAALFVLHHYRVTRTAAYVLVGIPLWAALLKSGVHATLAGVALAAFIPLRPDANGRSLLHELEHMLHPWVAFGVLPLFAFANAGVALTDITFASVAHPVPAGIILGLVFGKQIGILLACWLATTLRVATIPPGISWPMMFGVSALCGIGFTMSLFIASLAFEQGGAAYLGLDRLGILFGSLISGVAGYFILRRCLSTASADA